MRFLNIVILIFFFFWLFSLQATTVKHKLRSKSSIETKVVQNDDCLPYKMQGDSGDTGKINNDTNSTDINIDDTDKTDNNQTYNGGPSKCSYTGSRNHKTGVFFGNWKVYARGYELCKTPGEKLDRIFYAFLNPTTGVCQWSDPWCDLQKPGPESGECGTALQQWDSPLKGNMYQLKMMKKKYPHLKVFASIGGWTYSKLMHSFIHTDANRKTMVTSCANLIKQYSDIFDGVDLDLEYPCLPQDTACGPQITPSSNDKLHFTQFLQEWRKQLPDKLITIATSAAEIKSDAIDFPQIDSIVNSYNIMTYDFTSGSWGQSHTGHQTNPRPTQNDPIQGRHGYSAQQAGKFYTDRGASASKINIGVGLYGRGFKLANPNETPKPYAPAAGGLEVGTWEKNTFDYYDIVKTYSDGGKNVYWDDIAKAPYVWNKAQSAFITYDDERSICEKIKIVKENRYEGVFAWELSGDTDNFDLLKAMASNSQ